MVKFSVMYPTTPGARFDHDYYRDQHMPMIQRLLGDACKGYSIDKGLGGGAPGQPPTYVAMCHIYADSAASFMGAFGPNAKQIMADVPNYTDIQPVAQLSEVVVGP